MIEIKIEEGDRLDWALKVFKRHCQVRNPEGPA